MSEQKQESNALSVLKRDISESVMSRINALQEGGHMVIPRNYAVENELKIAMLQIQQTTDRNGNKVLDVCTKESIAEALLKMALLGVSVSKNQCYMIPYGKELQLSLSYFGKMAMAKRFADLDKVSANVIYKNDNFVYTIDPDTGNIKVVTHEQSIANISDENIIGVYCTYHTGNGDANTVIMSFDQVKKSWNQGPTKGQSPAHKNFPGEMAKKTVISRALKTLINSSDDSGLLHGVRDEDDDQPAGQRTATVNNDEGVIEDAEAVVVDAKPELKPAAPAQPAPAAPEQPAQTKQHEATAQPAATDLFNGSDPY